LSVWIEPSSRRNGAMLRRIASVMASSPATEAARTTGPALDSARSAVASSG